MAEKHKWLSQLIQFDDKSTLEVRARVIYSHPSEVENIRYESETTEGIRGFWNDLPFGDMETPYAHILPEKINLKLNPMLVELSHDQACFSSDLKQKMRIMLPEKSSTCKISRNDINNLYEGLYAIVEDNSKKPRQDCPSSLWPYRSWPF